MSLAPIWSWGVLEILMMNSKFFITYRESDFHIWIFIMNEDTWNVFAY